MIKTLTSPTTPSENTQTALSFISALWPWKHSPSKSSQSIAGVFSIVEPHKAGWKSHRMNLRRGSVGSIDQRLPRILKALAGKDIYFETALKNPDLIKARKKKDNIRFARGKASDVVAVSCLALDIDCADGTHAAGNLPQKHEAYSYLKNSCPITPSIVLKSGGGYHAYWLLDKPFLIQNPTDRREIEAIKRGWQSFISDQFDARGWHLDNVSDLSRVLRLPGTSNRKYPGHIVEPEFFDGDEPHAFYDIRQSIADFEPYKIEIKTPTIGNYAGQQYDPTLSINATDDAKRDIIQLMRMACDRPGQIHLSKRMPVTGWLARSGASEADVFEIVKEGTCHHRAKIDGEENAIAVARSCVEATFEKLRLGYQVTGFPTLAESIGEEIASKLLGLVTTVYGESIYAEEYKAFIDQLGTFKPDHSKQLAADKARAKDLQTRRNKFQQVSPAVTCSLIKLKDEQLWNIFRVLEIPEVCDLPADLFEEAFLKTGLSIDILEDARAKPINLDNKKKIRKITRKALKNMGDDFWAFLVAFSGCASRFLLPIMEHLELFQSVHYSDEAHVAHAAVCGDSTAYSHKITALLNCGKFDGKTYVNDVTREDHGQLMRGFRSTCKASTCPRCQCHYVKELYNYLEKSEHWEKEMLTARVDADEDSPLEAVKVWNRGTSRIRNIGISGAISPTFSPMGMKAGVFFVAENSPEALQDFNHAFPDSEIKVMPGREALHQFCQSMMTNALRTRHMMVMKSKGLSSNPWFKSLKLARKRGDDHAFPWYSMRRWKEMKRLTADEPADTRMGIQRYTHVQTKILIHEQSTDQIPLQHHEIVKLANTHHKLQTLLDDRYREALGPTKGPLLAIKRREIREYKIRMIEADSNLKHIINNS